MLLENSGFSTFGRQVGLCSLFLWGIKAYLSLLKMGEGFWPNKYRKCGRRNCRSHTMPERWAMVVRLCGTGCRNTNRWSDQASGECHTTVLKDRFWIFRRLSLLLVEPSRYVEQENELRACSTVWAIGLIRATCSGLDFDLFPLNALYLLFL